MLCENGAEDEQHHPELLPEREARAEAKDLGEHGRNLAVTVVPSPLASSPRGKEGGRRGGDAARRQGERGQGSSPALETPPDRNPQATNSTHVQKIFVLLIIETIAVSTPSILLAWLMSMLSTA